MSAPKSPVNTSSNEARDRGTTRAIVMSILELMLCFWLEPVERMFEIMQNVLQKAKSSGLLRVVDLIQKEFWFWF